jgi:molecular chaperone DnaK
VLESRNGARGLQALVRAGDPLPKKGAVSFRAGENLRAGSAAALNFKLWEGDIKEPIEDNVFIGTFRVAGSDFEEGIIPTGAEILCEFEVTDSGNIRLDISVPDIGGSFSSGHNYYSRQDAQIDYSQAAALVATEADATASRLDDIAKHVDDDRIDTIRERIVRAGTINADQAIPEDAKKALDEIRAARREIATLREDHLKAIRQVDLDSIVNTFNNWSREFARPDEKQSFDALVRTAQCSIDHNAPDFESYLADLRSKNIDALWRSDEFIVERYHWLARSPELFMDQAQWSGLIAHGQAALARQDLDELRRILINLDQIRFARTGEEEMLAMTNIVRG